MAFERDSRLQKFAEGQARDAVDFARANYSRNLDWSDESVRHIEEIAGHLHETLPDPVPSEEELFGLAQMLGSYVGEVFRRNHGADWGIVSVGGENFPGLKSHHGVSFWPWGRLLNRLTNGDEDNVWHYYQRLVLEVGASLEKKPPSLWKRLFRGGKG